MKPAAALALLHAHQAAVRARLSPRDHAPTRGDEGDLARETVERELGAQERDRLVRRLAALGAAIKRVRGGEYGVCGDCDRVIEPARLRAIPEALRCRECEDRHEQEARPGWLPQA